MAVKIQIRRDSAADWTAEDPVLASGEQGHETDTNRRKIGDGVLAWSALPYIFETATGSSPWLSIPAGIQYSQGLVGIDTLLPEKNLQIGQHSNNSPVPNARLLNAQAAIYGGTATNNGTASIGLYESVPGAFLGDYGFIIRYNAATNTLEIVSTIGGTEQVVFNFNRDTGIATYFENISGNNANRAIDFANAVNPQDLVTLAQLRLFNDAVKVTNTATPNLNTGPAAFSSFTTTDILGSTLGQFSFTNNGITPNFNGVCDIEFTAEIEGAVVRGRPGFRWLHNGNAGPWNRDTYIRNTTGDTESTGKVISTIPVVSGQIIQIQHNNFTTTGTITCPAGGAEFIVKRRA